MSHGISARCYLWCLQHGTVLGIIKNQGPEILDRHVGRQGQGIAFASIKIFMFLITKCKDILGTNTHHLHDHGRSICCGQVEESSPCINVPATRALVNQPFVIATDKGGRPLTLFTVELDRFITWCKAKCAGRGVPNSHPFFKKSLHSRIWLEGLSFPDSNGRQIAPKLWIQEINGFTLNHCVHLEEETEIVGMNRVHFFARHVKELHLGWSTHCRQGIDFETFLPHLGRSIWASVLQKSSKDRPIGVAGTLGHMISTRHLTLVPRRQHQILSTGASVRPRFSHVRHVAEVGVVDHARPSAGWNINDRGPIPLEIQHSTHIDSIRVRSEPQGSAIYQTSKDTCLVTSIAANGCKACSHGLH
mmetsp:Transcript_20930/g.46040  ORF Transcript_20930/g.46040 Transcript_20930/m.46040 type:complete len:361 (-) Transcript_20930:149-1231(-)